MSYSASTRRVFILGNPEKGSVTGALTELKQFAAERCNLVGAELGLDVRTAVEAGAETVIVLGGDGTLLGVARLAAGLEPHAAFRSTTIEPGPAGAYLRSKFDAWRRWISANSRMFMSRRIGWLSLSPWASAFWVTKRV